MMLIKLEGTPKEEVISRAEGHIAAAQKKIQSVNSGEGIYSKEEKQKIIAHCEDIIRTSEMTIKAAEDYLQRQAKKKEEIVAFFNKKMCR